MMSAAWDTEEIRSAPSIDVQCTMFVSFMFGPPERCDNESTKLVRAGCVHEHLFEYTVCDSCARGHSARPLYCNQCSDGNEPHECRLTFTITDWTPAATS